MTPGEYFFAKAGPILANDGRSSVDVRVTHAGDRPIQVGSHFHFFEVNQALVFQRVATYGTRLNIPAGTAVRFEPGDTKTVNLVPLAGDQIVHGHNGQVNGALDEQRESALADE